MPVTSIKRFLFTWTVSSFTTLELGGSIKEETFTTLALGGAIVGQTASSFTTLALGGTIKQETFATLALGVGGAVTSQDFSALALGGSIASRATFTQATAGKYPSKRPLLPEFIELRRKIVRREDKYD